jgi:hypothetical protein
MKACGPFLGLVISLFLFWGYNEAGSNVNSGFNVTIFGPHSQFSRAYSLKPLEHCTMAVTSLVAVNFVKERKK